MRAPKGLAILLPALLAACQGPPTARDKVTVAVASGPVATFSPNQAFGASLDGGERGEISPIYNAWNIAHMRAAGLPRISYRLRTELGIEAWHWTPAGHWSDASHAQGYWTGDDASPARPRLTYGYKLPRRGDTIDMANDQGFSRLDDGDLRSVWKTNPYLDARYTRDPAGRPQWAIVQLDTPAAVDAMKIVWGQPFARRYAVQYWAGDDEYDPRGRWIDFPRGRVEGGHGGAVQLRLADAPVRTQFLRLLMFQSSNTAAPGAADPRDAMGYAVAELYAGRQGDDGRLHDLIRHRAARDGQTVMHVSSTDPWHRAQDIDPDLEQPGLDLVSRSGLTNGLPMMAPVGVLYDTPENAAAELRYLHRIGARVIQVELGEEPDGQLVSPSDYGALYLEYARELAPFAGGAVFGGPSLQSGVTDSWLDAQGGGSWNGQFVSYLKSRQALDALGFFSFERYPFDDICGSAQAKLLEQSRMMGQMFDRLQAEGVPPAIPWIITEYGFSAYSGRAMVEMPSALLNADMVADFLSRGGKAAYLFGYGPNVPINQHLACAGRGNMMLWQADTDGKARWPMPAYFGARLMTGEWTQAGDGAHALYRASTRLKGAHGQSLVTAWPLRRPDGEWSVLLINRSPDAVATRVGFAGLAPAAGPVRVVQYSPAQYAWRDDATGGHPARDRPPVAFTASGWGVPLRLPGQSLTVVRGLTP